MTNQELRELDAWIDLHLFGRVEHAKFFTPTEDSSDAMDVLKKCAEKSDTEIAIKPNDSGWTVANIDWFYERLSYSSHAATLELAICLFAKQLFNQTTK